MINFCHSSIFVNYLFTGKGISVQFSEAVHIDSNFVHENRAEGIFVDQPFPVTLSNNFVTLNSGSGVMVSGQAMVRYCYVFNLILYIEMNTIINKQIGFLYPCISWLTHRITSPFVYLSVLLSIHHTFCVALFQWLTHLFLETLFRIFPLIIYGLLFQTMSI